MENDDTFLGFCFTVRTSGIAGSVRIGIEDEVLALDFDNAVALRLMRFDRHCREHQANLLARATWGQGEQENATTESPVVM